MREINKIAEGLFEKIRDRFEDVSLGDKNAHATQNPEDARFFNFDYISEGKNYGNVTISIIDETSLKVYFSKSISHDLTDEQRQEWYGFLKELREFAKRNLLSFEPRDITRGTLKQRDIKQVSKSDNTYSKDEVVSESRLYGTSRSSYENDGPVRIIIRHSDHINPEQRGSRSRKIRAIYLENSEGERLKLPQNSLGYARAMARHVAEGGNIDDEFGQHITEIAEECSKLKPFKAAMTRRVFEDEETQRMVEAAFEYHGLLKNTLGKMSGRRGYQQCKEQFSATNTSHAADEDVDIDGLRERFVKRSFNERMNDALPIVHKAYNMKKTNKLASQFESWANNIAESWDYDTDDLLELLADELPVGVDAINATSALEGTSISRNETYDDLVDELIALSEMDADEDARDTIMGWMQTEMPTEYQEIIRSAGSDDQTEQPEEEPSTVAEDENNFASMSRNDLLEFLNLDPLVAQHISNDKLREKAEAKSQGMTEGSFNDDGSYNTSDDEAVADEEDDYDYDQVDMIANAIIRRILGNVKQHSELIMKAGPDGVMNAARDVASFHAPVEELGSSDISIMVREVYNEVGLQFPNLSEGRVKELATDLKELTDAEFKAKYKKTKAEMKKSLSESKTQLNEYLLRGGMPIRNVLELNLFSDFTEDEPFSSYYEGFAENPQWMAIEQRYTQMAQALKQKILAQSNRKLTNAEANALESTWYDGADAYSDVEDAVEFLPNIYDAQIDIVDALLAGNITDEEFGDEDFYSDYSREEELEDEAADERRRDNLDEVRRLAGLK